MNDSIAGEQRTFRGPSLRKFFSPKCVLSIRQSFRKWLNTYNIEQTTDLNSDLDLLVLVKVFSVAA